jgi:hypothetical protein
MSYHLTRLQILNGISLLSGIITAVIGATMMPQTVTNHGDTYIGEAEAYNEDLRKAQIGSYGFKVIIIGLSITGVNIIMLLLICYCIHLEENVQESRIQPQPIQAPIERRVRISPTVTEIPDNIVISIDKSKNIKKWLGDTIIPDNTI